MPLKISIIIPTYNCAEFISEAIDSATIQTCHPHEIIVIDDGSTDNTEQTLSALVHERTIKYYKQNNQGPSAARNFGVEKAGGELICFLDADDFLLPECLQQAADFFQRIEQPAVLFQNFYKQAITEPSIPSSPSGHWEEGNQWDTITQHGDITASQLSDIWLVPHGYFILLLTNFPQLSGTVLPKKLFQKSGGFDCNMTMGEDRDLCLRLALSALVAVMKRPAAVYRRRPGSLVERREKYLLSRIKTPEKNLHKERLSTKQLLIFHSAQRKHYLDYGWFLFREQRYHDARNILLECKKNAGWSRKHLSLYMLTVCPRPVLKILIFFKQKTLTPVQT